MDWKKLLSRERLKKSATTDVRNEFESDYGRIIYSPAIRRMHDKTQVFPLTTDDNIHSRLTHSMEVMSLGYTFGIKLSQSKKFQERTGLKEMELFRRLPVLLQNICLIHDIGNAPFGHFGETIIADFFKELNVKEEKTAFSNLNDHQKRDFLNYDGNAQGLRVLTKLQYLDNPFGLNLTYATLGSFLKYPNYDQLNKQKSAELRTKGETLDSKYIEASKHGVFYSEKDYFDRIVDECGLSKEGRILRHPLCYLMEAADTIAYRCMDMEDGFNKKLFNIDYIKECFKDNTGPIAQDIRGICESKILDDNSKIVKIRVKLIGYFVKLAYDNFEANLDYIENGKYRDELVKDDPSGVYKIVSDISDDIFASREINYLESTGYSVMTGMLKFYIKFVFSENPKYQDKAATLISKSIIECSIEENLIEMAERKLNNKRKQIDEEIALFKENKTEMIRLEADQKKVEANILKFENIKEKYLPLYKKQFEEVLDETVVNQLLQLKKDIKAIVEPKFSDLDDYSKFRVIVDFISGMTDQYALNHFQKISGQKIS